MATVDIPQEWMAVWNLIGTGKAKKTDIYPVCQHVGLDKLETIHKDNMNMLHWAVVKNCSGFMDEIMDLGLFEEPHGEGSAPYLHLACMYGHEDVVSTLLNHRPDFLDWRVSQENQQWKELVAAHKFDEINYEETLARLELLSKDQIHKKVSAVDVAAAYLRRSCLVRLLNIKGLTQDDWLESITDTGLHEVMHNLLTTTDHDTVNFDFKEALRLMSPVCLKSAFQCAVDNKIKLEPSDPYNFLYMKGKWGWNDSAAECTKILVLQGWDVNMKCPPTSYPINSLFEHIMETSLVMDFNKELSCLEILLQSGADPRMTETEDMDGIPLQKSAAVKLVPMLDRFSVNKQSIHFICGSLVLLARFGCDLSVKDEEGHSLLHLILKEITLPVFMYCGIDDEMAVPISKLVGTVLVLGGDLHSRDNEGQLPLVCFMNAVLADLEMYDITGSESVTKLVRPVLKFLRAMEHTEACEVIECVKLSMQGMKGEPWPPHFYKLPDDVQEGVEAEMHVHFTGSRSLEHLCLIKVIRYWHRLNVKRLSLSHIMKEAICDLLCLEETDLGLK